MKLQENTIFADRYQLERLLGRGGFSEVWLAKDNWTHLRIALKVYAPGQGMDANGLQEFCGELANVFDLNHPNLLKPTHVDTWNDMPYLIMAYCSQGSLTNKIGTLSESDVWKLIHDVASGLAYLHKKDVVHQDIKPDNILIDESGNYVITDFGISTRARSTLRKSVVGGAVSGGTTAYMGPERFSRQPAPTKASDIWSFGAMVYEILEGNVPFGEMGGGMQKGGAEIPYLSANVSDALKYVIFKMLSKETWDRPTAEKLVEWSLSPEAIEVEDDVLNPEDDIASTEAIASQGTASGRETVVISEPSRATTRFDSSADNATEPVVSEVYSSSTGGTPQKSKAWVWILIVVCAGIIGAPIGNYIHNEKVRAEQERVAEQNRKEAERKRQEELRNSTLSVSSNSFTVSGDGCTKLVTIISNRDWDVTAKPSWVLCNKTKNDEMEISIDYNPNKSTRQGTVSLKTQNGAKQQDIVIVQSAGNGKKNANAVINKIWVEHDKYQGNLKGMLIHVSFNVEYKFNQAIRIYAFFQYRDGEYLKDFDNKYRSGDGYVYIDNVISGIGTLVPNYTYCTWGDFAMFMPYSQLDFTEGALKNEPLKLEVGVWDESASKTIGNLKSYNFNVTW